MERSKSTVQKYPSRREMLRYGVSLAARSTLGGRGISAIAPGTPDPYTPSARATAAVK
jgi:hypothetical protein